MRKIMKLLAITIGGGLLLLLALAVLLPLLVDANSFKPDIEAAVEDATGRELVIEGELSLSVIPWLGIELGRTRLGQPEGFESGDFASIESVRIGVRLLPLVRKELDVDRIEILAPRIRLQRDAAGNDNWSDLAAPEAGDAPASAEASDGDLPAIQVAGMQLSDGWIEYRDASNGLSATVSELQLELGEVRLPVDTELDASAIILVEQDGETVLQTPLDIEARVAADPARKLYAVQQASLEAMLDTPGFPEPVAISLGVPSLGAALEDGTASLQGMLLTVGDLSLRVSAEARDLHGEPRTSGELNAPEFNPARLAALLGVELPPMRASDALSSLTLDGEFNATPDSLQLSRLDVSLDQARMTGSLALASIEPQAIELDLQVDELLLDRYLAPVADEPQADDAAAAKTDLDAIALPVEALASANINGRLGIDSLQAMGFKASALQVVIEGSPGKLRLNPLSADFYSGGLRADVSLASDGKAMSLETVNRIEEFQLGPLSKDVFELEDLAGLASMEIDATARGRTAGDWVRDMNGSFSARVVDGRLEGFNLWASLREAYAKLKNREYDRSGQPDYTEFAELLLDGSISEGTIYNETILARLPFLDVSGQGTIDPLALTGKHRLQLTVLDRPDMDKSLEELKGVTVPVSITGSLSSPKVRPEVGEALKAKAKAKADQRIEEERDEAREELEDKVKDKLKDIFR